MKRIIVLGNTGSGKSTFSASLAKKINIECLHLDTIVYKHDWQEKENEEINNKIESFISKDSWIIDGNFLKRGLDRFYKADTIFFLDINRLTCFFSVIKRYFKYKGKHRDSRSDLCDEKLTKSYLKWAISGFYKNSRKKILSIIENNKDKNIIIFKNRRQIKKYLEDIKWI